MNYAYTAIDGHGKRITERLEAPDDEQALRRLHNLGYAVLSLASTEEAQSVEQKRPSAIPRIRRVRQDDIVAMSRELSIMIETGISISDALSLLAENAENPVIKSVTATTLADVSQGQSLSASMAKHPRIYTKLYVSMVASAEIGGTLHTTLNQAAEYLEASLEMRRKVKGALTYPAVLVVAMFGVIIFMVVFLIPRFSSLFEHMGTQIPMTFTVMMAISHFLTTYWWFLPACIAGLVYGSRAVLQSPRGNMLFSRFVLKIPSIGDTVRKIAVARILRSLAMLLESGVSMLVALDTVGQVAMNVVYEEALKRARSRVEAGISLTEAFTSAGVFPGIVCQMIAVGEKSGRLSKVLMHVAVYYEREIDARLKSLASVIEPAMIVILGIVVGFIAVSIFSPLYSIYDNIK